MKVCLVVLLLAVPHLCRAQGNELIVEFHRANTLSGVVVYGLGEDNSFPKVPVSRIECGKGEFRGIRDPVILQKVETDANGSFAFPWNDHSRTCLQVQTLGMNTLQVEVRYVKSGGKLKLKLVPGA
jgi:hypothetical protein